MVAEDGRCRDRPGGWQGEQQVDGLFLLSHQVSHVRLPAMEALLQVLQVLQVLEVIEELADELPMLRLHAPGQGQAPGG